MVRSRRAFSLVEIIVAVAVLAIGLLTLLSVFKNAYKQSSQSRNRVLAMFVARTFLEEVHAHPFGSPNVPPSWCAQMSSSLEVARGKWRVDRTYTPAAVLIEGRPQQLDFWVSVQLRTGGFVGNCTTPWDEAFITVAWYDREQAGSESPNLETVQVPLWK